MINVYDSKTTNFDNNGIVVLGDCKSAPITEELNGQYKLELEYPLDERGKWKYLLEGNVIKADGQLFRIYHKVKTLKGIKINARHIFYDLLDNFLEDITLTNINGAGALDLILTNTQYAHSFTSMSDISILANKQFIRKNVVESIMGTDGLINNIGGELVRDNFTIELLGARGLDRGVLVAYGKNVQGIQEDLDMDGLCTRLMPIGKGGLLLTEKYIDSIYIDNFSHPKIKVQEFSDCETENTLRIAGQEYMTDNKIDIPQFNYVINFIELSKTSEYKNYAVLERVYLGDTVTIKHNRLDINLKAKVIKITKNILTDRIEKIELGSFKDNIATTINNSIQEVKQDIVQVKSDYQKAIENATDLITGASGGNVVIRQNAEGHPYEILIMDTTDVMTAFDVWRWSIGGFGYSSTGINGPYETAITMDGAIVGKFISAISISASQIKTDELVVGTNIAMGANAYISWNNVTSKPVIPTLPSYITSTKITATTIESPSISAGTITGASISAGTISGASIIGGSITGTTIRTSNTTSYILMHDQYLDFYNAGIFQGSVGYKYNAASLNYDTGLINTNCSFTCYANGGGFDLRSTGMNYFWGDCDFRGAIKCDTGYIAKESWVSTNFVHDWELADYATQSWVSTNYTSYSFVASNYTQFLGDTVYLPNNCYLECLTNRLILHANSTNYISIGSGTMIVVEDGASRPV